MAVHLRLGNPAKLIALMPGMPGLIAGATGNRAFCAGADINALTGLAPPGLR